MAGSERCVELHGSLFHSRCSRCARPPFPDDATYLDALPSCERCAERGERGLLRPHIVWFGEALDGAHLARIDRFVERGAREGRLVFLAVGTSGIVYPAAGLVDVARASGGEAWGVNAEAPENRHRFHHFVQGRSAEVLPGLLA